MLFDWLPEPKWLSWSVLLAVVFVIAAVETFFPCQVDPLFASLAGNTC